MPKDILDKIPIKASFISLFGLFYTAFKHKIKLSDASTFDIEFNGRLDERNLDFCYTQTFSQKFIQSFSIPSETCIRNLYVDFKTYKQVYKNHTTTFLLSKNTKNTPNTFNASLYGLIIQYAKDEINKLNSKSLRFISFMLIYFLPLLCVILIGSFLLIIIFLAQIYLKITMKMKNFYILV